MRYLALFVTFIIVTLAHSSLAAEDHLKLKETWEHDFFSIWPFANVSINSQDKLLANLGELYAIDKENVTMIAKQGKGPGELGFSFASGFINDDIYVFEFYGKVNKFTLKDGTYKFDHSFFIKPGEYRQSIKDVTFVNGKWYGSGTIRIGTPPNHKKHLVGVYSEQGVGMRHLVPSHEEDTKRENYDIKIESFGNQIYVMSSTRLDLHIVDSRTDTLKKVVALSPPESYRRIPDGAFIYNESNLYLGNEESIELLKHWVSTFSHLENMLVDEENLILQLNSPWVDRGRYCVAVYDADTLVLKRTFFTNEYLIKAHKGTLYMTSGGTSNIDSEDEALTIHLYRMNDI